MYCYSNNGMSMRSVAKDYVAQKDEYLSPAILDDTDKLKVFSGYQSELDRAETQRQIQTLEAQQTPRRMREAVLTAEGKAWMDDVNSQIDALRVKL